jgi:uracil-DNA glycosylase
MTRLEQEIIGCEACPRLRTHCESVAQVKRKAYREEEYWGKPIIGFGDPKGRLWIVGLAPAAHGANRTGRIFTGDRSGEWLYRALHKTGFANQGESVHRDDGLRLKDVYISCVVRCAPPENKPLPDEIRRCERFIKQELELLTRVRVMIALGQIALHGIWGLIGGDQPRPKFGHGKRVPLSNGKTLILSYHPSQQNTFTGRLTEPMFDQVFTAARSIVNRK